MSLSQTRTTASLLHTAGAMALCAAVAAPLGCSRATRTSARGWDYETDSFGSDAPAQTAPAQTASADQGNTINTRVWHDPTKVGAVTRSDEQFDAAGPGFSARLAAAETPARSAPQPFRGGTDAPGLPSIHDPVDNAPSTAMLDSVEGLSQVTFAGDGAAFDPCVSRDGRFVAFAGTQHRPTADIYIKPINGSAVTQLTADPAHDIMPAISPDGKRIAFCSNRTGNWDIFVMSSSGGQAVQLTSETTRELHPSWSPDGQKIVFCRLGEVSGRWELWVQDVTQARAAEFVGYGLYPRWCPVPGTGEGGRDKIVFQRGRERGDRAFSIWTIDYKPGDVTSPTEIAASPTEALINPNWSADGQWITYAAVPNRPGATPANKLGEADLWIVSVTGSSRVNLTSGNFVNLAPTWSTDGRIYFVSNRAGVDNIWSITTERALAAATGGLNSHGGHAAAAPARATEHGHIAGPMLHGDSAAETAHVPVP